MFRTLAVLIKKEFLQIRRNSFLPKLIIVFPIVVMLVIPWVTTLDVNNIQVTVIDEDHSETSQRMISGIEGADYFHLVVSDQGYEQALQQVEQGNCDLIVEIPAEYERSLVAASPKRISVSVNSVNAIKGVIGMQYVLQCMGVTLQNMGKEMGLQLDSEAITVQYRYNPTMNYRYYMVPAIMIILMILICGFLPALSLVSEKEKGTIEQINVTPVGRLTFTLSKLIPYWLIGFFILSVSMLIARLVYGLVPAGSLLSIYLAALLFILTVSGLGVTIANRSDTMQQTMFVMFFCLVIFILMSGLLTPIASMPDWAQQITKFFPPRYFILIMRSVYLKGASITDIWENFAMLGFFAVLLGGLSAISYRKQS